MRSVKVVPTHSHVTQDRTCSARLNIHEKMRQVDESIRMRAALLFHLRIRTRDLMKQSKKKGYKLNQYGYRGLEPWLLVSFTMFLYYSMANGTWSLQLRTCTI